MWGRELRAGLVFVLVSLAVGTAVRGYRRAHEARFQDLVDRLEEGASSRLEREAREASGAAPASPNGTAAPASGPAASVRARPPRAPALRPASIDIDRADESALVRLPGIGPALAARIVEDRARRGPFGTPEGLLRVSGIGPKTLARLRAYLAPAAPASPPDSATPLPGSPR